MGDEIFLGEEASRYDKPCINIHCGGQWELCRLVVVGVLQISHYDDQMIRNDLNKNLQLFTARYQPPINIYRTATPSIPLICHFVNVIIFILMILLILMLWNTFKFIIYEGQWPNYMIYRENSDISIGVKFQ